MAFTCSVPQCLRDFISELENVSTPEALSELFERIYTQSDITTNPRFHHSIIFEPAHRCLPSITPEDALEKINDYYQKLWRDYQKPYLMNGPDGVGHVLAELEPLSSHAFYLAKYCEELATDPNISGDIIFHMVDASFARAISLSNLREDFTDERSSDPRRWLTKAWRWQCEKESANIVFVYLPDMFANSKEHLQYELNLEKCWLQQANADREFWCNADYRLASELLDDLKNIIQFVDAYDPGVPVMYVFTQDRKKVNRLAELTKLRRQRPIDGDISTVVTIDMAQSYEVCFVFWPERK